MKVPNIVVIGSLNMDIVIEADRQPKLGETILGSKAQFIPGGKGANQAVAAARLGAKTTMIGAVGGDSFGQELLKALDDNGIDRHAVKIVDSSSTGIASIFLASGDNSIVVVQGANQDLLPKDIDLYDDVIQAADIILIQLEISLETVCYAVNKAKSYGKTVVLNPAPAQVLPDELLRQVDYMTPNRSELGLLTGRDAEGDELEIAIQDLMDRGVANIITTLGADGSAFMDHHKLHMIPGYKVPVMDTTGAGDSFNAALAYSLALDLDLEKAVSFAAKVSALAVTKFGAQAGMPTMEAVHQFAASVKGDI
ncbi:ribokinase [Paenibacillus sp. IHBB 10380]|uniref:ribokinase n=1 Tax=Paenibacillus sp. IHBB 10380 TaxID=1566358 RepID=UPI0005CFB5C6|nr:ribokinase [Paenibacillus sp. IHBB 10380]AJS59363.1 ribokinase [Paenibacillus sp. IHBB 10380]